MSFFGHIMNAGILFFLGRATVLSLAGMRTLLLSTLPFTSGLNGIAVSRGHLISQNLQNRFHTTRGYLQVVNERCLLFLCNYLPIQC